MKRILFQGDSITDCGRNREDFYGLGTGYPLLVEGRLGLEEPEVYEVLNRGISGNRIVDLYARMKEDIINMKPDVLSILIGVNDVWHELEWGQGVSTEKFEKIYTMLLEELREALPDTRMILIEPFVLKGCGTAKYFTPFKEGVTEKAQVVRKMAEKFGVDFIPLQADLDELEKKASEGYWLGDGVHPTIRGHKLIADKWVRTLRGE